MKIDNDLNDEIFDKSINCTTSIDNTDFNLESKCEITRAMSLIRNSVLFVNCPNSWCDDYMQYGNSTICNSPKRMEIYKLYKK